MKTSISLDLRGGLSAIILNLYRRPIWAALRGMLVAFCLAYVRLAQAVTPAPDGFYPNFNTAEGQDALLSLDTQLGCCNTAIGYFALHDNTTGGDNTAVGYNALAANHPSSLFNGNFNTAVGASALELNTTGTSNTAVGYLSLGSNRTGSQNTAIGQDALLNNTNGDENTATGRAAMALNTSGIDNTADGFAALYNNGTGYSNTASGWEALYSNTAGAHNTATGNEALYHNTADFNTAAGSRALYTNSSGTQNTASGYATLYNNSSGSYNTALGAGALTNNTQGSNNVAIGRDAGANLTTGSNNIVIGAGLLGSSTDINVTRIGKTTQKKAFIGGIYAVGEPVAGGIKPVYINSNGQLGTAAAASSARFKEAIKPMDKASDGILSLKPVTFRYKGDSERTQQFGLIAEEVAKVNPDLVIRDEEGRIYSVRYDAVNAMLLNEFLKEHQRVNALRASKAEQKKEIAELKRQLREQAEAIRKVSDRIELSTPARRLASKGD